MKRVLTALVLIPVVVALIFAAPLILVWAALLAVALLCLREYYDIAEASGFRPLKVVGYGACCVLILARSLPPGGFLAIVAALSLAVFLQPSRPVREALSATAVTQFGLIYACLPFALGRALQESSPHWLFVALLVNWVGDSAAYFVGKAVGRHKLAPHISPGKTWEGTIASVALGSSAGAGYLFWFRPGGITPAESVALALLLNVAGQLGDLAESILKRGAGLKDSGSLLPGHGGMLDRVDGVLFALPAAHLFLSWAR